MKKPARDTLLASPRNLLWLGISLGIFYWFVESLLHVLFFSQGNLVAEIMTPDIHEIWKRVLVICLMIFFSIYAHYSISMRQRAELELQEREKELTQILENNPAGIMLVQAESRKITWANTNALRMIGSQKHSVEGKICHEYLCPDEQECCPVLNNRQTIDLSERILLTAEGTSLPILKSVTRVKYNGKDHLLETFFDLSDRKKMELELKLAHAELDQIFQTASVAMRVVDRDCRVLKINKTFQSMTGVEEKDAIGKKCYDVLAGSMCFTAGCPLSLILEGKDKVDCYVDKHRADGTIISCILTATPFKGPDGKIVGIVESFRDISELKSAQEAIRLERDKLDQILSHMSEGVSIVNSDYTIEYQNSILKEKIGDCEGDHCYTIFRQSAAPCKPCLMLKALTSGEVQHHEFEMSDNRSFEQSYTPLIDLDEQEKVVVLLRDITDKKASTAAMMRAEQLAALGEMAAGVAHEINNPINGIINYAQILINRAGNNEFISDIGNRMIKEGNRIARIVEGLLSFAQRKNEEKTPITVEDILSDSLSLTGVQMRKDNIMVQTEIAPDLPKIIGQAHEIEQVFVNIISNSIRALNKKYPESDENKLLKVKAEMVNSRNRPYVRVSFRDWGTGIPAGIMDKVRNPFFSTNTDGKSTGLGLSISHGIVNDHEGHLRIESVENEFTCVSVDLPISQAKTLEG